MEMEKVKGEGDGCQNPDAVGAIPVLLPRPERPPMITRRKTLGPAMLEPASARPAGRSLSRRSGESDSKSTRSSGLNHGQPKRASRHGTSVGRGHIAIPEHLRPSGLFRSPAANADDDPHSIVRRPIRSPSPVPAGARRHQTSRVGRHGRQEQPLKAVRGLQEGSDTPEYLRELHERIRASTALSSSRSGSELSETRGSEGSSTSSYAYSYTYTYTDDNNSASDIASELSGPIAPYPSFPPHRPHRLARQLLPSPSMPVVMESGGEEEDGTDGSDRENMRVPLHQRSVSAWADPSRSGAPGPFHVVKRSSSSGGIKKSPSDQLNKYPSGGSRLKSSSTDLIERCSSDLEAPGSPRRNPGGTGSVKERSQDSLASSHSRQSLPPPPPPTVAQNTTRPHPPLPGRGRTQQRGKPPQSKQQRQRQRQRRRRRKPRQQSQPPQRGVARAGEEDTSAAHRAPTAWAASSRQSSAGDHVALVSFMCEFAFFIIPIDDPRVPLLLDRVSLDASSTTVKPWERLVAFEVSPSSQRLASGMVQRLIVLLAAIMSILFLAVPATLPFMYSIDVDRQCVVPGRHASVAVWVRRGLRIGGIVCGVGTTGVGAYIVRSAFGRNFIHVMWRHTKLAWRTRPQFSMTCIAALFATIFVNDFLLMPFVLGVSLFVALIDFCGLFTRSIASVRFSMLALIADHFALWIVERFDASLCTTLEARNSLGYEVWRRLVSSALLMYCFAAARVFTVKLVDPRYPMAMHPWRPHFSEYECWYDDQGDGRCDGRGDEDGDGNGEKVGGVERAHDRGDEERGQRERIVGGGGSGGGGGGGGSDLSINNGAGLDDVSDNGVIQDRDLGDDGRYQHRDRENGMFAVMYGRHESRVVRVGSAEHESALLGMRADGVFYVSGRRYRALDLAVIAAGLMFPFVVIAILAIDVAVLISHADQDRVCFELDGDSSLELLARIVVWMSTAILVVAVGALGAGWFIVAQRPLAVLFRYSKYHFRRWPSFYLSCVVSTVIPLSTHIHWLPIHTAGLLLPLVDIMLATTPLRGILTNAVRASVASLCVTHIGLFFILAVREPLRCNFVEEKSGLFENLLHQVALASAAIWSFQLVSIILPKLSMPSRMAIPFKIEEGSAYEFSWFGLDDSDYYGDEDAGSGSGGDRVGHHSHPEGSGVMGVLEVLEARDGGNKGTAVSTADPTATTATVTSFNVVSPQAAKEKSL